MPPWACFGGLFETETNAGYVILVETVRQMPALRETPIAPATISRRNCSLESTQICGRGLSEVSHPD